MMAPQTPRHGESGTESSRTMGDSSNMLPTETQLQPRHNWVHRGAEIAATEDMTLDPQLRIVCMTRSSKKRKQHAIGCNSCRIEVHRRQLMMSHVAGVRREVHDQFIAARNGKPPWSTNASVRTLCEIEHHDVVTSGIFPDQFSDIDPW